MSTFKSISTSCGPVLYKERKSKFIGYGYNVTELSEVKPILEALQAKYSDASHLCYAYKIGLQQPDIRMNDDGEPSYSAGAPIFGQIEAFGLDNILLCVIRYFGGTKLGVGGLIQAYRETARACLESAQLEEIQPVQELILEFNYDVIDSVMRILAQQQLIPVHQVMDLACQINLQVPAPRIAEVTAILQAIPGLRISGR